MKKSTKGALAAAAAGSLLLGGAGSLAYWTDAESITGTSINPAPCADDIRNDHNVISRKPIRMPPRG